MIDELFAVIEDRKANPTPSSYTASLFAEGQDAILQKVGEESIEVLLAAKGQGNQRLIEETADLTYHMLVLLSYHGLTPQDIARELRRRHGGDS